MRAIKISEYFNAVTRNGIDFIFDLSLPLRVSALNIKLWKFIAAWCLAVVLSPAVLSGEWRKQPSGTLAWLHSIYFLNVQTGWIAGSNGALLTTDDGGATWKATAKPTEDNLRDVFFLDAKTGWLLCERDFTKLRRGESRSYLLETSDGGATWSRFVLNPQISRFIVSDNRRTAWAVGELGSFYKLQTEDLRWQRQAPPTRYKLRGGALLNDREAVLLGAGATILHTSDAGKIWRGAIVYDADNAFFNSVFFVARSLGWAVAGGGKIFATTDGGKTWRAQNSPTDSDLFDVRFLTANEGWVIGDNGTLLYTADSGNNWRETETKTTHRLERLFFINRTRGFAVGFGGTILSYADSTLAAPQFSK
jgi:photosystem II stability/assembly factor-like uncharacterized protein